MLTCHFKILHNNSSGSVGSPEFKQTNKASNVLFFLFFFFSMFEMGLGIFIQHQGRVG